MRWRTMRRPSAARPCVECSVRRGGQCRTHGFVLVLWIRDASQGLSKPRLSTRTLPSLLNNFGLTYFVVNTIFFTVLQVWIWIFLYVVLSSISSHILEHSRDGGCFTWPWLDFFMSYARLKPGTKIRKHSSVTAT